MLLIASRRKLSLNHRQKRKQSTQTHYLSVDKRGQANSAELATDIGQSAWLSHLGAAGAAKGVVIYVHGFNTEQKTMLNRHYNLKRNVRFHGFKGAVIAFDWPNFDHALHYSSDKDLAQAVAPFLLSDVVAPILNKFPGTKVHLVAHSMGAWLMMRALEVLEAGAVAGLAGFSFDEVCFVSADVDADDFKANSAPWKTLTRHCKRVTNYCSSSDRVLSGVGEAANSFKARLGQAGWPAPLAGETYDVEGRHRFAHFKKHNGKRHSHTWWFHDAYFFGDLSKTLQGKKAGRAITRMTGHAPPKQMLRTKR